MSGIGASMIRNNIFLYRVVIVAIGAYEMALFYVAKALNKFTKRYFKYCFKKVADIDIVDKKDEKKLRAGDIKVYNEDFFPRTSGYRSLGFMESYMDGWWDTPDLEELFFKMFRSDLLFHMDWLLRFHQFHDYLRFNLFNLQTQARSFEVGQKHYDQSNDLFKAMLDKSMTYSCGYWKNAKNLDEAQINKMDLLARKLQLKPGMRVLDIGCGWGGLCKYLAENYGVEMVGCTVSVEGAKVGQERCAGLPVDIRVVDFREMDEKFDRIVSVGMFEHVGHNNYRTFMEVAHRCLKDDGILVLHTIGVNHPHIPMVEPWFNTYIFPNGILPYHTQINQASDGLFILEDWQNMGIHYNKTLMAWLDNFNKAWPSLKSNYENPDKFYRMWVCYLQLSAGSFRARTLQLWQVVLSKNGVMGGYEAPR